MKVLQIDVNCKSSSTGKIVYSLYKGLNKAGHSAAVCYGRGPLVDEPNIFKFGIDVETIMHAGLTRITGLTGRFSPFSTNRVIRFMEKFQPDVVNIHELHAYFVDLDPVINYLKERNIPTVWTFHCEFMYTGKCGHAYDCEQWKTECRRCPQLRDYPASWFFDFTRKMFHEKKQLLRDFRNLSIVTPSEWLKTRVLQSFLSDKDVYVIHNGIDTSVFCPRKADHLRCRHSISDDEKVVLAVAPNLMSESKGGEWVVRLAQLFEGQSVKFILIGVDEPSRDYGKNVVVLGRTQDQVELAHYYSLADVFVICSRRENFPTTCIEALACGTPIVGFDEGGTRETAPKGLGKFVAYGDIDALYGAVLSFITNDHLTDIKSDCVEFATMHYDESSMLQSYMKLYTKVKG